MFKKLFTTTALAAGVSLLATPAGAVSLLSGFGGASGFGEKISGFIGEEPIVTSQIDLPFLLNMNGQNYSQGWVNLGGSLSFSESNIWGHGSFPAYEYDPGPALAPLSTGSWVLDWDSTDLYLASPNSDTLVATWVTQLAWDDYRTNSFQLVLQNRADTGEGNFDFSFRYDRIEFPNLHDDMGEPQAGYDLGNGIDDNSNASFRNLAGYDENGDYVGSVFDLAASSNVSVSTPGLWNFTVRDGQIADGGAPHAPLMPDIALEEGWIFNFNVTEESLSLPVFVDPEIAIGYDYVINSGPDITAAWFADVGNSGDYTLLGWDGSDYTIGLGTIGAEEWFNFADGGVDRFAVRGIDAALSLDPTDPQAFVTGLQFADFGPVTLTMSPVTEDGNGGTITPSVPGIPEPSTWLMLIAGFGLVGAASRRRNRAQTTA